MTTFAESLFPNSRIMTSEESEAYSKFIDNFWDLAEVGSSATHSTNKCDKCTRNLDKKYHPDYTKCPYNSNFDKSKSC